MDGQFGDKWIWGWTKAKQHSLVTHQELERLVAVRFVARLGDRQLVRDDLW